MAPCVSDVLLLDYNTDIGACYIMLTGIIIKYEQKVSCRLYLIRCLPAVSKPILVFICQQSTRCFIFGSYSVFFLQNMALLSVLVTEYFLTLSSLHHLSCCGIKITSCTKASSRATPWINFIISVSDGSLCWPNMLGLFKVFFLMGRKKKPPHTTILFRLLLD